jgi:hypothetical protein
MKRNRNQRRRQGGMNVNRALDSNGPDVRIRGTANQIYEKYLALARDAASSGDRVKAENYLQHAEHYFRLIRAMQPQQQPGEGQPQGEGDFDGDQPSIGDYQDRRFESHQEQIPSGEGEGEQPSPERDPGEYREAGQEQRREPRHEPREGERGDGRPNGQSEGGDQQQRDVRGDDDRRHGRRRRSRRPFREGREDRGRPQAEGGEGGLKEPADTDEVPA